MGSWTRSCCFYSARSPAVNLFIYRSRSADRPADNNHRGKNALAKNWLKIRPTYLRANTCTALWSCFKGLKARVFFNFQFFKRRIDPLLYSCHADWISTVFLQTFVFQMPWKQWFTYKFIANMDRSIYLSVTLPPIPGLLSIFSARSYQRPDFEYTKWQRMNGYWLKEYSPEIEVCFPHLVRCVLDYWTRPAWAWRGGGGGIE